MSENNNEPAMQSFRGYQAAYVQKLPPPIRGLRRLVRAEHPLTITALMGCIGLMQAGLAPVERAVTGLAIGGIADGVRYVVARRYVKKHERHSELAQVVGIRFIDAVANTLRKQHGYEGEYTLSEEIKESNGNSLFAAGYLTRCAFTFEEEDGPKEHKFVFKYTQQGEADKAIGRAIQMRSIGFDEFVAPFIPQELMFPIEKGLLYEDRGVSLEELHYGDVQLQIDPETNPANNLPDIFGSTWRYVYNDRTELPEEAVVYVPSIVPTPLKFETGPLEKFGQKKKVLTRLDTLDPNNDLSELLDLHHETTFGNLFLSKIHGDLKPGNVLEDDDGTLSYIDTDQLCLDVADMERAHFDIRSDFAHTAGYQQHRASLLEYFSRWNNPNLREYHQDMDEGLVYLNKLLHFTLSQRLDEDDESDDVERTTLRRDLKQVCRFMLEKTRECFAAYEVKMRADDNPEYEEIKAQSLVDALDRYAEDNFGFLDGIETTGLESMTYAEWAERQLRVIDNPTQRENLDVAQQGVRQFLYQDRLSDAYCFMIPLASFLPALSDTVYFTGELIAGNLPPHFYWFALEQIAESKITAYQVAASACALVIYSRDRLYHVSRNAMAITVASKHALSEGYKNSELKMLIDDGKECVYDLCKKVKSIFTRNETPSE